MKWTVTTPPASRVVDLETVLSRHRITNDAEIPDVEQMIEAATDYAQEKMQCSLIDREITAEFLAEDLKFAAPANTAAQFYVPLWGCGSPVLYLPRGPVSEVTSVKDADDNDVEYALERVGDDDRVRLAGAISNYPVTVVYTAGYGASSSAIPASVRQAIIAHVGDMWMVRLTISDRELYSVPNSLNDFYRMRSRKII